MNLVIFFFLFLRTRETVAGKSLTLANRVTCLNHGTKGPRGGALWVTAGQALKDHSAHLRLVLFFFSCWKFNSASFVTAPQAAQKLGPCSLDAIAIRCFVRH